MVGLPPGDYRKTSYKSIATSQVPSGGYTTDYSISSDRLVTGSGQVAIQGQPSYDSQGKLVGITETSKVQPVSTPAETIENKETKSTLKASSVFQGTISPTDYLQGNIGGARSVYISGSVAGNIARQGNNPMSIREDIPYMTTGFKQNRAGIFNLKIVDGDFKNVIRENSISSGSSISRSNGFNLLSNKTKRQSKIEDRVENIDLLRKDLQVRTDNTLKFFGYKETQFSFFNPQVYKNIGAGILAGPGLTVTALPQLAIISSANVYALADIRSSNIKLFEGGSLLGSGDVSEKLIKAEFVRSAKSVEANEYSFIPGGSPINYAGFSTVVTAGVGASIPAFRASSKPSMALKQTIGSATNEQVGYRYFGIKETKSVGKGNIIETKGSITIEKPNINPVENRVIRTPEPVVSIIGGKDIKTITPEGGRQVTNIQGTGKYKDFTLNIQTDPITGKSIGKLLKSTKNDVSIVRRFETKPTSNIKITESVTRLTSFDEAKANDFLYQSRKSFSTQQGLSTQKKGLAPNVQVGTLVNQEVGIRTRSMYEERGFNQGELTRFEQLPTEFSIVPDPVKLKDAFVNQQGYVALGTDTLNTIKPTEFNVLGQTNVKQSIRVSFDEVSKGNDVVPTFSKPSKVSSDLFKLNFPERQVSNLPQATSNVQGNGVVTTFQPKPILTSQVSVQTPLSSQVSTSGFDLQFFTKQSLATDTFKISKSPLLITRSKTEQLSRQQVKSESLLSLNQQSSLSRQFSKSLSDVKSLSKTDVRVETKQSPSVITKSIQQVRTVTETKQVTQPKQIVDVSTPFKPNFIPSPFKPIQPKVDTPFVPFLPPALGGGLGGFRRGFGAKRGVRYTPSFDALFFRKRGKYKKSKVGGSGLDYRPITPGFNLTSGKGFKFGGYRGEAV